VAVGAPTGYLGRAEHDELAVGLAHHGAGDGVRPSSVITCPPVPKLGSKLPAAHTWTALATIRPTPRTKALRMADPPFHWPFAKSE